MLNAGEMEPCALSCRLSVMKCPALQYHHVALHALATIPTNNSLTKRFTVPHGARRTPTTSPSRRSKSSVIESCTCPWASFEDQQERRASGRRVCVRRGDVYALGAEPLRVIRRGAASGWIQTPATGQAPEEDEADGVGRVQKVGAINMHGKEPPYSSLVSCCCCLE